MNIEKELTYVAFLNREYQRSHLAYDREMEFFRAIQQGDIEMAHRLFKPLGSEKMGALSENPLRNLIYHFVITVAFLTRYCIEGGMGWKKHSISVIFISAVLTAAKKSRK